MADSGRRTVDATAPTVAVFDALDSGRSEFEQTLEVLRALDPAVVPEELTLGQADRGLLAAHDRLIGGGIEVTAECGHCGEPNTFLLAAATVPPDTAMSAWIGPGSGLRQPRCRDLLDLPADPDSAAAALAARCAIGPVARPRPADALERIDTSLAGQVNGPCVGCGTTASAEVDVAHRVLLALAARRARYDAEVDLLAARYGWTLDVIDALPDARRQRLAAFAGGLA
jgi:hypothetical protein